MKCTDGWYLLVGRKETYVFSRLAFFKKNSFFKKKGFFAISELPIKDNRSGATSIRLCQTLSKMEHLSFFSRKQSRKPFVLLRRRDKNRYR